MDLNTMGLICDNPQVKGREYDDFARKYRILSADELKAALRVDASDIFNVLNQSIPCVGCRRRYYECLFLVEWSCSAFGCHDYSTFSSFPSKYASMLLLCHINCILFIIVMHLMPSIITSKEYTIKIRFYWLHKSTPHILNFEWIWFFFCIICETKVEKAYSENKHDHWPWNKLYFCCVVVKYSDIETKTLKIVLHRHSHLGLLYLLPIGIMHLSLAL